MLLRTSRLFAFALLGSLVALIARGESTQLYPRSAAKSKCEHSDSTVATATALGWRQLPHGEFEYVLSEYHLSLPSGDLEQPGLSLRIDEKVFRDPAGLMIHSEIGCQTGRALKEFSLQSTERSAPRIFSRGKESVHVAFRSFRVGYENGGSFFQLTDLPPKFGINAGAFDRALRNEWSSYHFEKLDIPYHYALRLERVTPSGITAARIIYRNTESSSRGFEVTRRVIDAALEPVL